MATDDIPEGLFPFDDVMRDDRDQDAEVFPFDNERDPSERPELPELPEQQRGNVDWASIREGIYTVGLGAKAAAELYKTVTVAVTGKDPFNGVPINIPTGESQYDKDLARIRKLADGS